MWQNAASLERGNLPVHDGIVIPFPGAGKACSPDRPHSLVAGGQSMEVKHTHPACTEEERLAQLRAIKRLCTQLLCPGEQEERAG